MPTALSDAQQTTGTEKNPLVKPAPPPSRRGARKRQQETSPIPQTIDNLIHAHGSRVMSLLGRLLGDREDARDAYQDTWCAIWRTLPRLRPEADPWPYIRKAAVGKAVDRLRSRGAERVVPIREEPAERTVAAGVGADLSTLPARERTALSLFFWEGLSVSEIGAELGVPEGTVKTWMFRGRRRLREQLEERSDEM